MVAWYFLLHTADSKVKLMQQASTSLSPLISATTDPLRALNHAYNMTNYKNVQGVCIVMIDTWRLPRGSFMSCNPLREVLRLRTNNLYITETLIWQEVPAFAIQHFWAYNDLDTGRFGNYFSPIFEDLNHKKQKKLSKLRRHLSRLDANNDTPWLLVIVRVLVQELGLDPNAAYTQDIGRIMYSWKMGLIVKPLGKILYLDAYGSELDSFCHRLRRSLFYLHYHRGVRKATDEFEPLVLSIPAPARNMRPSDTFHMPPFEDWMDDLRTSTRTEYETSLLHRTRQYQNNLLDMACSYMTISDCVRSLPEMLRKRLRQSAPFIPPSIEALWTASRGTTRKRRPMSNHSRSVPRDADIMASCAFAGPYLSSATRQWMAQMRDMSLNDDRSSEM